MKINCSYNLHNRDLSDHLLCSCCKKCLLCRLRDGEKNRKEKFMKRDMKDITVVCDQYEWSKLKDFGASLGFLGFNIAGKRIGKKPLILCKETFIFIKCAIY